MAKYYGAIGYGEMMETKPGVWTEQIKEYDHLQYMYLPRLSAIAESAWSLPNKNFDSYVERVANLLKLYDAYGYNYARSYWRDLETKSNNL